MKNLRRAARPKHNLDSILSSIARTRGPIDLDDLQTDLDDVAPHPRVVRRAPTRLLDYDDGVSDRGVRRRAA